MRSIASEMLEAAYFCTRPVTARVVNVATRTQCSALYESGNRRYFRGLLIATPPAFVPQPTPPVDQDEDEHASDQRRDQDLVEQAHIVDQRRVLWAGPIVAQPGGGEVGGRVGVTFLARSENIGFHDGAVWIGGRQDVMHPMTIDTNRFVCHL